MDWLLCDNGPHHKRVNQKETNLTCLSFEQKESTNNIIIQEQNLILNKIKNLSIGQ